MSYYLENNSYYENNGNSLINEYSKHLFTSIYIDTIEIIDDFNHSISENNNIIKNINFLPDILKLDNFLKTREKSANIEIYKNTKTYQIFILLIKLQIRLIMKKLIKH